MRVAYLISDEFEKQIEDKPFIEEYALFKPFFEERQAQFEKVIWSDPGVDWSGYDRVIPKAVWDYFNRPEEFKAYLEEMKQSKIPFVNSIPTIQWNLEKVYLDEIQKKGLPVLENQFIEKGSSFQLKDFDRWPEREKLILKPSISGASKNTIVTPRHELHHHQALADEILSEAHLMIQPFYPEVSEEGEYSFFFFGGELSHAVRKVPVKGDFRANPFFHAETLRYDPTESEVSQMKKTIACAPEEVAYARVDVLRVAGEMRCVELELIEPYLFFEGAKDQEKSARLFVSAILEATVS